MTLIETEVGFEIQTHKFLAFFGKKFAQVEALQRHFDQIQFLRLKQVHGCDLVERPQFSLETPMADGQTTTISKLGLCVSTADCLPVLIYNSFRNSVAAIHAGWRGVAQKIVSCAIQNEIQKGARPQDLTVLIGPHIQKSSFEIQEPVLNELLSSCLHPTEDLYVKTSDGKYFFDLNTLQKMHLAEIEIPSENIFTLYLDTKSDLRFHSFRRDKDSSGRQQSFICLR